jgi:hypothetical protein
MQSGIEGVLLLAVKYKGGQNNKDTRRGSSLKETPILTSVQKEPHSNSIVSFTASFL